MQVQVGSARRMIAAGGIAFVALFMGALVMLGELVGSFADSDAHFMAYHASQSNQVQIVIGGYLFTAAGLALLVFLVGMTAPSADEPANLTRSIALFSGLVGVALFLAGGAALATSGGAKAFGALFSDEPLTGDGVAVAPQLGYVLIFLPAMWALACSSAAQIWHARGRNIWPRWFTWLSALAIVALLLSAALFMAIFMLPVWVGAASVNALRRAPGASLAH